MEHITYIGEVVEKLADHSSFPELFIKYEEGDPIPSGKAIHEIIELCRAVLFPWVIGTGTLIHSFGSMNLSLVIFIPLKQVAMCTCINKNQFQRIIVLAPNQQPIWFKMTFPTARILSRQSMGFVF